MAVLMFALSSSVPSRLSWASPVVSLEETIARQAELIRSHEALLANTRKTFEAASAAAGIGLWECRLADQSLTWSDVVYDIFDLPRGSVLERDRIVECYSDASVRKLHLLREKAIRECNGFSLDAEITTSMGNTRWIRITATVECRDGVPFRIFGMKQDITQEKILGDQTRYLAEYDVLTGLPNRSQFESAFADMMKGDSDRGRLGALVLADLDGFKRINDTFGHSEGDECLKEAAFRLRTLCAGAELVARLGGDEFAMLIGNALDHRTVAEMAQRIVEGLTFSVCRNGLQIGIGASVGIAYFEPCQPEQLFKKADSALYSAKNAGRGAYRIYGRIDDSGLNHSIAAA